MLRWLKVPWKKIRGFQKKKIICGSVCLNRTLIRGRKDSTSCNFLSCMLSLLFMRKLSICHSKDRPSSICHSKYCNIGFATVKNDCFIFWHLWQFYLSSSSHSTTEYMADSTTKALGWSRSPRHRQPCPAPNPQDGPLGDRRRWQPLVVSLNCLDNPSLE